MNSRILIAFLLTSSSISGCLGASEEDSGNVVILPILEDPCTISPVPVTQTLTSIEVNGVEREFRLSVPTSDPGTSLPLVIAFHGGTDSQEDFAQQAQFDQLGDQEKFVMAYAIAEQDRTAAEGEWFLNTAATSREDNEFAESIVDELSKSYCIDQDRLYSIGYSLGAMFTYEIACQLNHRFAATASFAGTMPISPESCDLTAGIGIMHIHGKLDYIIYYYQDWDWKEGEHEGVGTMSEVPALIDYWADKSACQATVSENTLTEEQIVHSECKDGVRIEHYGLQFRDHNWPNEVNGVPTYELMWNFLSEFTRDSN